MLVGMGNKVQDKEIDLMAMDYGIGTKLSGLSGDGVKAGKWMESFLLSFGTVLITEVVPTLWLENSQMTA